MFKRIKSMTGCLTASYFSSKAINCTLRASRGLVPDFTEFDIPLKRHSSVISN